MINDNINKKYNTWKNIIQTYLCKRQIFKQVHNISDTKNQIFYDYLWFTLIVCTW